jgi:hypothetical protein
MRRSTPLALTLAVLISGLAVPARASGLEATAASPRCARGSLEDAAVSVFGPGTEVVGRSSISGLKGALVLEPRIAPGTRARLLAVGESWCEASSGFNLAWVAQRRSFSEAASLASAYARLAAAPYFDAVTVTSIEPVKSGTYVVRTHARTNGIEARWLIATDEAGVRAATWTATALGQRPFDAEIEGLTALPGGTETYARASGGWLVPERGLPTAESARLGAAPSIAEYVSPDGFRIAVSLGDSRVAVDPGMDTGVQKADIVRQTLTAIKVNYEDFYAWGMRKGWGELEPVSGPNKGYVYLNDALSLYCWACVFIADDFQIHMITEVDAILGALGYTYPDSVKAWQDIIGHEMFHNFQNRYVKPGPLGRMQGRGVTTAYSEGTARAQEAMHSYSDVSYQGGSLMYANDANGCNGYNGSNFDSAMASGVFNKGYTACYFWLSWIAGEGVDGLLQLVSTAYPTASPTTDGSAEGVTALGLASDLPVALQLARFAGGALTRRGYVVGPPSGAPRDWAAGPGLDRWNPGSLSVGGSATGTLAPSGMLARRVDEYSTVSTNSAGASLFVVIDDGVSTTTSVIPDGSVCVIPKEGETVWVGVVRTATGSGGASFNAAPLTCPIPEQ